MNSREVVERDLGYHRHFTQPANDTISLSSAGEKNEEVVQGDADDQAALAKRRRRRKQRRQARKKKKQKQRQQEELLAAQEVGEEDPAKSRWTRQEEEQLNDLVFEHQYDWAKVAAAMPTERSARACRVKHYRMQQESPRLRGTAASMRWDKTELAHLRRLAESDLQWPEISAEMFSLGYRRSASACKSKWFKTRDMDLKKATAAKGSVEDDDVVPSSRDKQVKYVWSQREHRIRAVPKHKLAKEEAKKQRQAKLEEEEKRQRRRRGEEPEEKRRRGRPKKNQPAPKKKQKEKQPDKGKQLLDNAEMGQPLQMRSALELLRLCNLDPKIHHFVPLGLESAAAGYMCVCATMDWEHMVDVVESLTQLAKSYGVPCDETYVQGTDREAWVLVDFGQVVLRFVVSGSVTEKQMAVWEGADVPEDALKQLSELQVQQCSVVFRPSLRDST